MCADLGKDALTRDPMVPAGGLDSNRLRGSGSAVKDVREVMVDIAANRTSRPMLRDRLMGGEHLFRGGQAVFSRKLFHLFVITAIRLNQLATELIHVRTMSKLHDKLPYLQTDRALGYEAFAGILFHRKSGIKS